MLELLNAYMQRGWFDYREDGSGVTLNCNTCLGWLEDDMFYTNILRGLATEPNKKLIISLSGSRDNINLVQRKIHIIISKFQYEVEKRDKYIPVFHVKAEYPVDSNSEKEQNKKGAKSK